MGEVWFYHLERQSLEHVLPVLLERARTRGWSAVVQATSAERVAALDELLWTYADASFLPHGSARDGDGAMQPVWLTDGADNPNASALRIFIDGADVVPILAEPSAAPTQRAIVLFDGRDSDGLAAARAQFRSLRDAGHSLSYWRQTPDGRWEQQT
jgi:DNA polymerase-3 subunit chi